NNGREYLRVPQQEGTLELDRLSTDSTHTLVPMEVDLPEETSDAGVYLGIWNIYATLPQFLASFISMIVFSVLEPGVSPHFAQGDGKEGAGDNVSGGVTRGISGTAVCLAIGAICSLVAA